MTSDPARPLAAEPPLSFTDDEAVTADTPGFPRTLTLSASWTQALTWAEKRQPEVERALLAHGALLLRGLTIPDTAGFEQLVVRLLPGGPVEYRETATPRSHVGGSVLTSTEYPADREI